MNGFCIEPATPETLQGWLHVHNTVIPNAPLTEADGLDRLRRHRLLVATLDGEVVGSTTMRSPVDDAGTATVIARVLPEFRGRGLGTELYERSLAQARDAGARRIETCVLETNRSGLRFALKRGFREIDRYVLDGDVLAFIDLVLVEPGGS